MFLIGSHWRLGFHVIFDSRFFEGLFSSVLLFLMAKIRKKIYQIFHNDPFSCGVPPF